MKLTGTLSSDPGRSQPTYSRTSEKACTAAVGFTLPQPCISNTPSLLEKVPLSGMFPVTMAGLPEDCVDCQLFEYS